MPVALVAETKPPVVMPHSTRQKNCKTDCAAGKPLAVPDKESKAVHTVPIPPPVERKYSFRAGGGLMLSPGFSAAFGFSKSKKFTWESVAEWASLPEWKTLYNIERRRFGLTLNVPLSTSLLPSVGLFYEQMNLGLTGGQSAAVNGTVFKYSANQFSSTHHQIQLQAGIANRWDWGPVFYGAEWMGVSLPLATLSESYSKKTEFPDSLYSSAKSVAKFTAQVWSVRILNITAGVSF
jgi:hypothetical protein